MRRFLFALGATLPPGLGIDAGKFVGSSLSWLVCGAIAANGFDSAVRAISIDCDAASTAGARNIASTELARLVTLRAWRRNRLFAYRPRTEIPSLLGEETSMDRFLAKYCNS